MMGDEHDRATPVAEPPPGSEAASSRRSWKGGDDKRGEDRASITLRVDYKRLNTFFADYTKNISKGGTFIRTTKPLDIGTEFVFVLSVPSSEKALELKGEVKWVVTEDKATEDNPPGMGIKFKFEHEEDQQKVDQFVERLMDDALGPHLSEKLLKK
jgi:type IV pilus assembly protein PilZ